MRLILSLLPLLLTSFSYLQKQRGSDTLEPGEMFPGSASRPAGLWVPDEGHVPFQPSRRSPEAPAGRMLFHRLGNHSVPPALRLTIPVLLGPEEQGQSALNSSSLEQILNS